MIPLVVKLKNNDQFWGRIRMRTKLLALIIFLTFSLGTSFAFAIDGSTNRHNISSSQGSDAAAVYKSKCVKCHGADGKGKPDFTPDFTDAKWQSAHKDEEITQTITDGKGEMPGYDAILDKDQIAGLVKYIRSLAKGGTELHSVRLYWPVDWRIKLHPRY
jgi:mono/diheme cytochrome c family protein